MSELPADRHVLGAILQRHARERPDALCAHFPDSGNRWRYADTLAVAQRAAAGLHLLGVQRGDRVLCWLPNGEAFLRAWFGAAWMGAVHAPCNLSWRGRLLEHALALSGARVAVVHAELLPRLGEIELHALRDVIVVGDAPAASIAGLRLHDAAILETSEPVAEPAPLQPWDDIQLMFTSGTTGPSKGAICSFAHMAGFMGETLPAHFGPDERFYCVLPLFHAGGAASIYAQLIHGGGLILPSRFRSDAFWPQVRDSGATTVTLLGVMTKFLMDAPASAADRDHTLRAVAISPLTAEALAFSERFGVSLWTSYGATEMGVVLSCEGSRQTLGSAGRLRAGYEVRLVDENDMPVAKGATGELIVRTQQPWRLFSAYVDDAAATLRACRNGWYHSGDLMREGEEGLFYFRDRKKDAIRRRGENISSQEVEAEVAAYPGILEVAAYAVPASDGEDEVMVALGIADGAQPAWADLVAFLAARMPHYMVPRYYRTLPTLPRNETGKLKKDLLRQEGVTGDSWDREAAGIRLRGERLGTR